MAPFKKAPAGQRKTTTANPKDTAYKSSSLRKTKDAAIVKLSPAGKTSTPLSVVKNTLTPTAKENSTAAAAATAAAALGLKTYPMHVSTPDGVLEEEEFRLKRMAKLSKAKAREYLRRRKVGEKGVAVVKKQNQGLGGVVLGDARLDKE